VKINADDDIIETSSMPEAKTSFLTQTLFTGAEKTPDMAGHGETFSRKLQYRAGVLDRQLDHNVGLSWRQRTRAFH
jgi:hypothetical protein